MLFMVAWKMKFENIIQTKKTSKTKQKNKN